MDITESILDTKINLAKPTKRHIRLKSKHDIIYNYKQYIHKQFIRHRIYTRAEIISNLSKVMKITPAIINQINNLDSQITVIVLSAEKEMCPKQRESVDRHTPPINALQVMGNGDQRSKEQDRYNPEIDRNIR
jgi:hypothetical protein